jgi:hypothetical protein
MLDTLDTRAGSSVLRVRAVGKNGVLELEGADARTVRVHVERCAPCHRPDIDGRMDPRAAVPPPDFACTRCRKASGAARMLLCDGVERAGIWSAWRSLSRRCLRGIGSALGVRRGRPFS